MAEVKIIKMLLLTKLTEFYISFSYVFSLLVFLCLLPFFLETIQKLKILYNLFELLFVLIYCKITFSQHF